MSISSASSLDAERDLAPERAKLPLLYLGILFQYWTDLFNQLISISLQQEGTIVLHPFDPNRINDITLV